MSGDRYTFLPWARFGLASAVSPAGDDPADPDASYPPRAPLDVSLRVLVGPNREARDVAVGTDDGRFLRLYGPGDVVGIDPGLVLRVHPEPGATSFKPNDVPLIEFTRPDVPWLFTPAAPDDRNRLRPWLVLVTVRKQPGVRLVQPRDGRLPVLEVQPEQGNAADELPNLAESWAWAHVQVAGDMVAESLQHAWKHTPERVLSRILSPRNLEPDEDYIACLVPAFDAGVGAGLGADDPSAGSDEGIRSAWGPDTAAIRLPVYHSWEFRTGREGDFESLARMLEGHELDPDVGTRPMDVRDPGFPVPMHSVGELLEEVLGGRGEVLGGFGDVRGVGDGRLFGGASGRGSAGIDFGRLLADRTVPEIPTVKLEGALRRPNFARDANPAAFANELRRLLRATMSDHGAPVVGPPVYGRFHAGLEELPRHPGTPPAWAPEINLDVRHRAAAGFGVEVVRERQENLLAAAWDLFAEILRVNRTLRQAQLAREASSAAYGRHIVPLGSEAPVSDAFLSVTGPVRARVATRTGRTVAGALQDTRLSPAFLSGAYRRIARQRGPFMRRGRATAAARNDTLHRVNEGEIDPARTRAWPDGTQVLEIDALKDLDVTHGGGLVPADTPLREHGERAEVHVPRNGDIDVGELLAGIDVIDLLDAGDAAPAPPAADLEAIRNDLLAALDPEVSVPRRIRRRLAIPDGLQWPGDGRDGASLEPLLAAPYYPQPMYRALAERSQDLLLPGLDRVPPNTVSIAENNPEFIASYMLGLNHEMAAELTWREFPTMQRETFFRVFWERAGLETDETADLVPIEGWDSRGLARQFVPKATGSFLVLVVRGELLRQFPDTQVYAVPPAGHVPGAAPATPRRRRGGEDQGFEENPDYEEVHPVFRGDLEPDVTFLGFPSPPELSGAPDPPNDEERTTVQRYAEDGWYFVFEGPPTAPRFGLDETLDFGVDVGRSWSELRDENTPGDGSEPTGWHAIAWGDLIEKGADEAASEAALRALTHAPALGRLWFPTEPGESPGLEMADTQWALNSAHMASIFLQLPVRVAFPAADLLGLATDSGGG